MVEPLRVVPSEKLEILALVPGQVRIVGNRLGREVVGGVGTHFVQVDEYGREVVLKDLHPAQGLGMVQRDPVAVQVEVVVVGPPAGPRFVVLGRQRTGVWLQAFGDLVIVDEPIPSVRVLDRVDHHDRLFEDMVHDRVVTGRQQVVGR